VRHVLYVITLTLLIASIPNSIRADDAQEIQAVHAAAAILDEAFQHQNEAGIKRMMTPDHLAVTPYYDGPKAAQYVIDTLPELDYHQTIETEPKVTLLGDDAALRTFTAKFKGTFKGKPIAEHCFVTEVMVKRRGRWIEAFYQMTALTP